MLALALLLLWFESLAADTVAVFWIPLQSCAVVARLSVMDFEVPCAMLPNEHESVPVLIEH